MRAFFSVLALLVVSSIWVADSVGDILTARASAGWPSTPGLVHSVGVKSEQAGRAGAIRPSVLYGYTVDGVGHSNDRVDFARKAMSRNKAMAQASRFQAGQTVTVRYDPKAPEQSALEVGVAPMAWVRLGIGLAMFVASNVGVFQLMKRFRTNPLRRSNGF